MAFTTKATDAAKAVETRTTSIPTPLVHNVYDTKVILVLPFVPSGVAVGVFCMKLAPGGLFGLMKAPATSWQQLSGPLMLAANVIPGAQPRCRVFDADTLEPNTTYKFMVRIRDVETNAVLSSAETDAITTRTEGEAGPLWRAHQEGCFVGAARERAKWPKLKGERAVGSASPVTPGRTGSVASDAGSGRDTPKELEGWIQLCQSQQAELTNERRKREELEIRLKRMQETWDSTTKQMEVDRHELLRRKIHERETTKQRETQLVIAATQESSAMAAPDSPDKNRILEMEARERSLQREVKTLRKDLALAKDTIQAFEQQQELQTEAMKAAEKAADDERLRQLSEMQAQLSGTVAELALEKIKLNEAQVTITKLQMNLEAIRNTRATDVVTQYSDENQALKRELNMICLALNREEMISQRRRDEREGWRLLYQQRCLRPELESSLPAELVDTALASYWTLRHMGFADDIARQAVKAHPDNVSVATLFCNSDGGSEEAATTDTATTPLEPPEAP